MKNFIIEGKKKRRSSQFSMDVEDEALPTDNAEAWTTEGIAAADDGQGMDTSEAGVSGVMEPQATPRKVVGKRGATSRAQKQRRKSKLEKGLAHASRVEGKALKLSSSKAKRVSSKSLWVTKSQK